MEDALSFVPHDSRSADLSSWLVESGLLGMRLTELLETYCSKLVDLGVPLFRVHVTMTAVHPNYGGIGFNWRMDGNAEHREYAHRAEAPEDWQLSPFQYMLTENEYVYREKISRDRESKFPLLNDMRLEGATDYLAQAVLFQEWDEDRPITNEDHVDGALVSWMAHGADGFSDRDLALIQSTFPTLALAIKSSSHRKMAEDLLGVYLGKDAGKRVLSGEIERGSTRWIDAVICYFDFEGFTALSQQLQGEALITMLNTYFDPVVACIEAEGGNVLKFMGDGLLAIFDRAHLSDAPDRALRSVRAIEAATSKLSAERLANGEAVFRYTAALHVGRVLYGNIGAPERLDFTVIGPDVNLAARIGGMHKSLGQNVVLSGALVDQVSDESADLISLGRYMLRGVKTPQELFTIYEPDAAN